MKIKLLFALLILQFSFAQQRTCGMQEKLNQLMDNPLQNAAYLYDQSQFQIELDKLESSNLQRTAANPQATIRIPVAVHFPSSANASAAVKTCLRAFAQTQVNVLNADYNGANSDITNWASASSFYPGTNTGSIDVEFVLATQNHPAGTGIANGVVAVTFGTDYLNGSDSDATWAGYMNLVCRNIPGGTLGYSPLGGHPGNGESVVIDNNSFSSGSGCTGYIPSAPYNLGRTLTHELGHFFNLDHTFAGCDGSNCAVSGDRVCDTPPTNSEYFDCVAPGSVSTTCGSTPQLTMNYMDYVEDSCMYMFTAGQATRMTAWYNYIANEFRTNALLSNNEINPITFSVYPNPSKGIVNIQFSNVVSDFSVEVYDSLGRPVNYSQDSLNKTINLTGVSNGVYFVSIKTENSQVTKKILVD